MICAAYRIVLFGEIKVNKMEGHVSRTVGYTIKDGV
jgi:hypothetical protein